MKSAKRLQESQRGALSPAEDINDIVDEMILKAFKIVNRGVRFLDVLEEDKRSRAPASVTVMATVMEESYVPPTPPAERNRFEEQQQDGASEAGSRALTDNTAASIAASDTGESLPLSKTTAWNKRMSSLNTASPTQQKLGHSRRISASMSHRVSLVGPSPAAVEEHLISERLNSSHDRFLSHLGSFIGRLHWQSLSRQELSVAIKQSAASSGELLAVVDGVCANCIVPPAALHAARSAVFECVEALVFCARDTMANVAAGDADVILPQDSNMLLASATACVKATGDCVSKAKGVIERIGDFEYESEDDALGIDLSILDIAPDDRSRTPSAVEPSEAFSMTDSMANSDATSQRTSPSQASRMIPKVPKIKIPTKQSSSIAPQPPSSNAETASNATGISESSSRPTLPPLPKLTTTISPTENVAQTPQSSRDHDGASARFENLAAFSAGSSNTYLSRDSETSIVSQTSTRATTPDQMAPRPKASVSDLSNADSSATNNEEPDDLETKLMEKTFAHELMFNKEGQVTGGTLPALVERLTAHESTPDATFVSTFFLTFRLFCTPVKLTTALIDRFDYVADSPQVAAPVRLRVYNAFKGWLECHWRHDTDNTALAFIVPFAQGKLARVLPSAGKRLSELALRVSTQNTQASRIKFSIGKTNTVIGQYVPADVPLSAPTISKHQHHLLNNFKAGTGNPTILDFEPIEIARQLTLRQMSIFCAIMPEELIGSRWMKNGGVDAPNVKAMSSLSTDLSNFVAETVLQHPEVKKRATVIKQWIKIASHCNDLHNYDGLMAIVCSLNSSTISRLRKTWDGISEKRKEMFRSLQKIVDPSQNNKVLRLKLQDHAPPCLPFLGMYLTDLTFIDMGNAATKKMSHAGGVVEEGSRGLTVVNFDKHTRTAKIIGELQRFQMPHRLTELPDMQDWLTAQIQRVREAGKDNVQVSNYRKSLLLEPREARRDLEPPTPVATSATSGRGDLFGWMSRDRSAHSNAQTPV